MTCLLLAGCATNPVDFRGKPLDEAISEYGNPAGAVDYQGARAFFFRGDVTKSEEIQENKDLLNPDMPIKKTDFRSNGCFYTINALWISAYKEWKIQSFDESPSCTSNGDTR